MYICGRAGLSVRVSSQGVAVIMMRSTVHSSTGEHLLFCLLPTNQDIHLVLLGISQYFWGVFFGSLRNLCVQILFAPTGDNVESQYLLEELCLCI